MLEASATPPDATCAIYLRTARIDSHPHDDYLKRQEEDCRTYALERGWTVDQNLIFLDVGSGFHLDRPRLTEIRQRMTGGEFDIVLIHDLARLTRNASDVESLRRESERADVCIVSLT